MDPKKKRKHTENERAHDPETRYLVEFTTATLYGVFRFGSNPFGVIAHLTDGYKHMERVDMSIVDPNTGQNGIHYICRYLSHVNDDIFHHFYSRYPQLFNTPNRDGLRPFDLARDTYVNRPYNILICILKHCGNGIQSFSESVKTVQIDWNHTDYTRERYGTMHPITEILYASLSPLTKYGSLREDQIKKYIQETKLTVHYINQMVLPTLPESDFKDLSLTKNLVRSVCIVNGKTADETEMSLDYVKIALSFAPFTLMFNSSEEDNWGFKSDSPVLEKLEKWMVETRVRLLVDEFETSIPIELIRLICSYFAPLYVVLTEKDTDPMNDLGGSHD
jgi:hypothetical protein